MNTNVSLQLLERELRGLIHRYLSDMDQDVTAMLDELHVEISLITQPFSPGKAQKIPRSNPGLGDISESESKSQSETKIRANPKLKANPNSKPNRKPRS